MDAIATVIGQFAKFFELHKVGEFVMKQVC